MVRMYALHNVDPMLRASGVGDRQSSGIKQLLEVRQESGLALGAQHSRIRALTTTDSMSDVFKPSDTPKHADAARS